MTRIKKWENYRNEINQLSQIGYSISNQTKQIEKYKMAINKINPTILQGITDPNINLQKSASEIIVSQKQISNDIINTFNDFNKIKHLNNKNNISTILFNLKNENILDENKKVKKTWLEKDQDYSKLSAYIDQANLNLDNHKEFEKDLKTKFENLSATKQQTEVGTITQLSKNIQKNIGHHVFVISISIALLFFIITLILLFVRWFA